MLFDIEKAGFGDATEALVDRSQFVRAVIVVYGNRGGPSLFFGNISHSFRGSDMQALSSTMSAVTPRDGRWRWRVITIEGRCFVNVDGGDEPPIQLASECCHRLDQYFVSKLIS